MRRIVFLAACLLTLSAQSQANDPVWQHTFDDESTWSRLTFAGTLLSASESSLVHTDTDTGDVLWVREDLAKLAQFNVNDVPGTNFLVISERLGNVPPKSRLMVLNASTGETIWDMGEHAGGGLGAFPLPDQNLLVYAADMTGQESGTYLIGLELESGAEKWKTRIGSPGSLPLHPSDVEAFIRTQDLNGHPPPLVHGDLFILPAGDIFAFDLNSGELRWRFKAKASVPHLKNTYARPVAGEGVLYVAGSDSVFAVDLQSGAEKWRAKIDKGAIPELQLVGNKLVGRLGGTFSNGKTLVSQKPFGAFAVDTESGSLTWKWTKAKDSITNLLVSADHGLVYAADKQKLYALELNAGKKGKVAYDEKLEFKRSLGKADVAAKSIGAVGGLLSGGIGGGLKGLSGGGDRSDPPLDISMHGEQLVVRAQYHVLGHSIPGRKTDWSIEFEPPGMSPLALVAMGAVTVTAAKANAQGAWGSSSASTSRMYADSTLAISGAFQNAAAKRFAAAEKARSVAFFLTKDETGEMVLMGIDLATGSEVGRVSMPDKEPRFMVDEVGNRVYYFRDNRELLAYDF